jgi:RHS repeat-associated protein
MERDEETGLQCHGVRYYAPWLGRWVSADPIGLADGVNRFAYVNGSPVASTDSNGMQGVPLLLLIESNAPPKPEYRPEFTAAIERLEAAAAALRVDASAPEPSYSTVSLARYAIERPQYGPDTLPVRQEYREKWFAKYGQALATAAEERGVPRTAALGIAFNELLSPTTFTDQFNFSLTLATDGLAKANKTSFGPVQMQVRVAAEVLSLDPRELSGEESSRLVQALMDPRNAIILVTERVAQTMNRKKPTGTDAEVAGQLAGWYQNPSLSAERVWSTEDQYAARALEGAKQAEEWMATQGGKP